MVTGVDEIWPGMLKALDKVGLVKFTFQTQEGRDLTPGLVD